MYSVPFAEGKLQFHLPSRMTGVTAVSLPANPIRDLESAMAHTLYNPMDSPPLHALARPSD